MVPEGYHCSLVPMADWMNGGMSPVGTLRPLTKDIRMSDFHPFHLIDVPRLAYPALAAQLYPAYHRTAEAECVHGASFGACVTIAAIS
jgi:hypothetical protein